MLVLQQTMAIIPGLRSKAININKKKAALEKALPNKHRNENTQSISVATFSKICANNGIIMGRNRMFFWLRNNGYLSKQKNTWNMPMQKYIQSDIFRVKETFIFQNDEQIPKYSPLITLKGKNYLMEKIKEDMIGIVKM